MQTVWDDLLWFLIHRHTRYVAAWLVTLGLAGYILHRSWHVFDDPRRADGNSAHTQIDFGAQWLMGRLLVSGNGQRLYHRDTQRQLVKAAYPRTAEVPDDLRTPEERGQHDADLLMGWMMGAEDETRRRPLLAATAVPLAAGEPLGATALFAAGLHHWDEAELRQALVNRGGPLYPPVNAFYYAPLGLLDPQPAYHVFQVVLLAMAFVAGLALSYLTEHRLWWPVATAFVLTYPGHTPNLMLGQNAALTLAVVTGGWALIGRGRPVAGGVVWGLLAFKPVWALAFFLVPLLTARWRTCLAMIASGTALALATVPAVGLHSWLDWLRIGRDAAVWYDVDHNWVSLSRDLLSIPRRWLLDFTIYPARARERLAAMLAGWALLGVVLELTVRLARLRPRQARQATGPSAAFLLLGAWLCCYHFMYYDVLLTALPVAILFDPPRRLLVPRFLLLAWPPWRTRRLAWQEAGVAWVEYHQPRLPVAHPGMPRRGLAVANFLPLYLLVGLWIVEHSFPGWGLGPDVGNEPWDTYVLLAVWLWCGWTWLRTPAALD